MVDIAKCKGDGCTLKESCRRYTAKPSLRQSYFVNSPYKEVNGKQECELYWESKIKKEETDENNHIRH